MDATFPSCGVLHGVTAQILQFIGSHLCRALDQVTDDTLAYVVILVMGHKWCAIQRFQLRREKRDARTYSFTTLTPNIHSLLIQFKADT